MTAETLELPLDGVEPVAERPAAVTAGESPFVRVAARRSDLRAVAVRAARGDERLLRALLGAADDYAAAMTEAYSRRPGRPR